MPIIVEADGTEAYVAGIVIEDPRATAEGLTQAAQLAWYADPPSLEKKATFAMRLRQWVSMPGVDRPALLAHALMLEKECEDAAQAR